MHKKVLFVGFLLGVMSCETMPSEKVTIKNAEMSHHSPSEFIYGDIFAVAQIQPKSGSQASGRIWFAKSAEGLQVYVWVNNVNPGLHGIHIHEFGDCSAPDGSSAGGHFNPTNMMHGDPDPKVHHIGDLGNIVVGKNGSGVLSLAIPTSDFNKNVPSWDIIIGKSVILHSGVDDLKSQPAGNSGSRIGCAIISKL